MAEIIRKGASTKRIKGSKKLLQDMLESNQGLSIPDAFKFLDDSLRKPLAILRGSNMLGHGLFARLSAFLKKTAAFSDCRRPWISDFGPAGGI